MFLPFEYYECQFLTMAKKFIFGIYKANKKHSEPKKIHAAKI